MTIGADRTVLILGSGNLAGDQTAEAVLDTAGFDADLGVQSALWNGEQFDLEAYEAVVVLNSFNWRTDIPVAGQQALIDYVEEGGGLVTGEWLIWNDLTPLADLLPVEADNRSWITESSLVYTLNTPDVTINQELNDRVDASANTETNGSETLFLAKPGATTFYNSVQTDRAGLVGWDYEDGRVISFSSVIADTELQSTDFAQLFVNSVDWSLDGEASAESRLDARLREFYNAH